MEVRKVIYTKELGRKVAEAARPDRPTKIHVIHHNPGSWSVVIQGRKIALRRALSKRDAIRIA